MFSYVMQLLYRVQSTPIQKLLVVALIVLIAAVLLVSLARWLHRRRQDRPESWTGLLTDSMGSILKILIGLGVVGAICLHLRFLSEEFTRQRGGVTASNYAAVKDIWGRPHVQRELNAYLATYTTRFYDKDGLELDPEKLRASSQPIGFRKVEQETIIPGNPIAAADHLVTVTMNYRRKGAAWYPCFEVDGTFSYVLRNFSSEPAKALFDFPLPSNQGLVDDLTVTVDDKPPPAQVVVSAERLTWGQPIAAGAEHRLLIRYHSRGMDFLRLDPGSERQFASYRFQLRCVGVGKADLNYPIGCMTPTEVRSEGADTVLDWKLQNALTRFGMGLIVPRKTQGGYYVGRILAAAPWGLVLLLAMVIVTFAATGRAVQWVPLAVMALGYELHYLLAAHLADYAPGLAGAMILSGAALIALIVVLELAWADRFAAWTTVAFFVLFVVVYPLLRISGHDGLLMSVLYVLLLGYVVAVLIGRRRRTAPLGGEALRDLPAGRQVEPTAA